MSAATPAIILGGTGYVAGELLRLIAGHPRLVVAAILSDSQPGAPVSGAFAHLQSAYPDLKFAAAGEIEGIIGRTPVTALFSAAPHGISAAIVDKLLSKAVAAGTRVHCVDISADFRYATQAAYEAVYKHAHGAPARIREFTCAVPEHMQKSPTPHVAHPGCFATATLLASVPLLALGLTDTRLFVTGITGSTGSGRKPVEGTHHPHRHSDFYSYGALSHRHVPEITACAKLATGIEAEFNFVPHSGPFARGIHVTVQASLKKSISTAEALDALTRYYKDCPFVRVAKAAPRVKDVAASNYSHLGAVSNGNSIAVMSVLDNLNKGAAGGAIQWMNRLLGLAETTGLTAPAPGWT
ncbi:MAG TPA: N-acetyl-gamma-glutamyl-phosphate reductase [Steroidobacteraceae bacterium]|jgi:N-acetyl-gamma-glutamyl-phosphate reductase|nr:N-acetyl-gamma-glutamyl-phosphate reductase [Steroidobacteraceae bacterium]HXC19866.1 N-acetyl-gamma-glutamyl-phosphate reductase [Steroidobacteraceae bacterium]